MESLKCGVGKMSGTLLCLAVFLHGKGLKLGLSSRGPMFTFAQNGGVQNASLSRRVLEVDDPGIAGISLFRLPHRIAPNPLTPVPGRNPLFSFGESHFRLRVAGACEPLSPVLIEVFEAVDKHHSPGQSVGLPVRIADHSYLCAFVSLHLSIPVP